MIDWLYSMEYPWSYIYRSIFLSPYCSFSASMILDQKFVINFSSVCILQDDLRRAKRDLAKGKEELSTLTTKIGRY